MNFFSKCKYRIYKTVKITLTNIIYQNEKSKIYRKRIIKVTTLNKLTQLPLTSYPFIRQSHRNHLTHLEIQLKVKGHINREDINREETKWK